MSELRVDMLREYLVLLLAFSAAHAYFTLPGRCPENVKLQEDFRLANFYNPWHQVYHYASDGREINNCSSIQLVTTSTGVHANLSRVDRGLFGRYSVAQINIPIDIEDSARLGITFVDRDAPRRLVTRSYPFWVLATNDYFATVYTCQYSTLIDKHYIYIWVLSRSKILNDVSLQLATDSIDKSLGIKPEALTKDDLSEDKCRVKYFEEKPVAPVTFRIPVLI